MAKYERLVRVSEDFGAYAAGGYENAVRRLFEFEEIGRSPDQIRSGTSEPWERYTSRLPDGTIHTSRGWEMVLGRLLGYEGFGLWPEELKERVNAE